MAVLKNPPERPPHELESKHGVTVDRDGFSEAGRRAFCPDHA
jgi:hypothetical protein